MQFATNKMSCSMRYRRKGQLHLWSKSSDIKSIRGAVFCCPLKLFFPFLRLLHLFTIPSNLLQVHPTLNYSSNLFPRDFMTGLSPQAF